MKKKSNYLASLKQMLWENFRASKDAELRRNFRYMHQTAQFAEEEVSEIVKDMEMWSIRNPAFPDDMVGYPDDDIKLFNEIEEENKKKKDDEDHKE